MAIAIVDYCKGNLRSVQRGIEAVGFDAFITSDPDEILRSDAIVLPGVGAFNDAATTMRELGQTDAIRKHVLEDEAPFLGICLGLQLLLTRGDEGCEPGQWCEGLGLIEGESVRMEDTRPDGVRVKVPHVGWNSLEFEGCAPSPLFDGIEEGSYFYFTHSYRVSVTDPRTITSYTTHATAFPSSLRKGNIYGTQFHPEKSSSLGLRVLQNFGRIVYEGKVR